MLQLSTKGRYATRIMVYLAMQPQGVPVPKQEIAQSEQISADYAEQILRVLKSAGLVASHRGVKGGFTLARDPERITVADVLDATEGAVDLAPCVRDECRRATQCVTRRLWRDASSCLSRIFGATTIRALAGEALEMAQSKVLIYDI
ncbi:Rrf2 family transcriptional regulator [bacterium]|nr:Rrf2 family transcriptional regulator [bacterium]